jgi:hypothetical protein
MSDPLLLLVMALATYRLTRLLTRDTFPPVLWLRDRLAGGWRPMTEPELEKKDADSTAREIGGVMHRYVRRSPRSPYWLAELVSCPWCSGGWISLVLTAGTWATIGLPAPILVWPAVWAAGSWLAAQDWA